MSFIFEQLQQLGMVAIIMLCAIGGTVGILKLIRRFAPGREFPKGPVSRRLNEKGEHFNG